MPNIEQPSFRAKIGDDDQNCVTEIDSQQPGQQDAALSVYGTEERHDGNTQDKKMQTTNAYITCAFDVLIVVINGVAFFVIASLGGLYMEDVGEFRDTEDDTVHNYKGVEMFLSFVGVVSGFVGIVGSLGDKVSLVAATSVWLVLQWSFSLINHRTFCRAVNQSAEEDISIDGSDHTKCEVSVLSASLGIGAILIILGPHIVFVVNAMRRRKVGSEIEQGNRGGSVNAIPLQTNSLQDKYQACMLGGGKECKLCNYIGIDVSSYFVRHGMVDRPKIEVAGTSHHSQKCNSSEDLGDDEDWARALP